MPPPGTFTVNFDDELIAAVKHMAGLRGQTPSEAIREACRNAIREFVESGEMERAQGDAARALTAVVKSMQGYKPPPG